MKPSSQKPLYGREMGNKLWLEDNFGKDYMERNPVTEEQVSARVPFFSSIFNILRNESSHKDYPASVLEVGAGQGTNLVALARIIKDNELKTTLHATEPFKPAREAIKKNAPTVDVEDYNGMLPVLPFPSGSFELVFTSGVLIHVPTAELVPSIRELYRVSSRYILTMEYFSPVERNVPYHDSNDTLWLRDYGSLFLDNHKLKVLGYGFLWKRLTRVDNITWWLFEKVN